MTTEVRPTLATFPNRAGLQEAVLRLLGPPPHCYHRDEDGEPFHRYPYEIVWLVIDGGAVYLRAKGQGSLTVSVRVEGAEVAGQASAEFMIKAPLLAGAVAALPDGALLLEHEEFKTDGWSIPFLRFTSVDTGSLACPVEQMSEGPPLLQPCDPDFSISAAAWYRLHERVFSARGPGKANLKNEATHGVRVEIGPDVKMITTDGHRIHADSCKTECVLTGHTMMLLPDDFCEAVGRLLKHHANGLAKLTIDYRQDSVVAEVAGDQVYRERKIGLVFPPYQEFIDKIEPRMLALISAPLSTRTPVDYLERLLQHRPMAVVALLLSKERLLFRSDWSTIVDFEASGPSRTLDDVFYPAYEGEPRQVKVDAKYLLEALRACGGIAAFLSIGEDTHDAVLVRGGQFLAVIMPTKCDDTDPEFANP